MQKAVLTAVLMIGLSISSLFVPYSTQASGTTNSRNQQGDVIIRDEDGVIYLTSETVGDERPVLIPGRITPPEGFARDIVSVINSVLSLVMLISGLLVLMYLIWGALQWITSGGDKGKIESARQKMTAAVIGLIIVSASYAIALLVYRFLGFDGLDDLFENVRSIDDDTQIIEIVDSTRSATRLTPTPSPSASPVYSDNLGELMRR